MPPSNDSALALADQLRSLADPELVALLAERGVTPTGIRDFFDLADALMAPESVAVAFERLQRPALIALGIVSELGVTKAADAAAHLTTIGGDAAGLGDHLAAGRSLGLLLEHDGLLSVPPPVAARFDEAGPLLPAALIADPAPAALAPVGRADAVIADRGAAARAFETTGFVAELVAELQREPARELARGGIALPDGRRLAASIGVDLDAVPGLLEIGERAGLVARGAGERIAAEPGGQWLHGGFSDRWTALAAGWLERLPTDVLGILRDRAGAEWGAGLEDYLRWLYPAGGEWIRERIAVSLRDAELLGITDDHVPSTPGALLIAKGTEAAGRAMGELFPAEVEKVYLLDDLSVVSPGPLAPALDARLRGIAESEGGVLAPTYRVTTSSLNRAMAAGETAETIRRFLGSIALAGIPQPLEYLMAEAAARYGLVRVAPLPGGGSVVRSVDTTLLRTLAVDSSLATIGLSRSADGLTSRFEPAVVFWSLAESRYPVAAEDAEGRIVSIERPRRIGSSPTTRPDPMAALIERLRVGSPTDAAAADRAWLARQLDVAIRGKLGLTVTVTLQDGSSVSYQLEPASVAGGRLRARDRRTDLERTLPLSSITAVGPASEA
jgi:hypothetical protein